MAPGTPSVPEGFVVAREGRVTTVLRAGLAGPLRAAGVTDPEAAAKAAGPGARRFEGRGRPVSFPVPGVRGLRVVARRYLHGGLLRGITGGLFPGSGRFLRELALAEALHRRGAGVAEPLGVVVRRAAPGVARGWMLTREVEGAEDLRGLLLRLPPGERARAAALAAAGRAVRALHDAGVLHADLHVKNLLLPRGGGPAVVLDLDGARAVPGGLSRAQRAGQLQRLDRSLLKLALRAGAAVSPADRWRVVRGYLGRDRLPREERALWLRRHRAHLARHRLGWRMGGG